MDAGDITLIVVGVVGTIAILWLGYRLDRRSQRITSEKAWRAWTILTRVRNELFSRLRGPLRLQDQRVEPAPKTRKRKPATRRRKAPRKPTR